jgi:hypothetical protein
VVDEFEIADNATGFRTFFQRIEAVEARYPWPVTVAYESLKVGSNISNLSPI